MLTRHGIMAERCSMITAFESKKTDGNIDSDGQISLLLE